LSLTNQSAPLTLPITISGKTEPTARPAERDWF